MIKTISPFGIGFPKAQLFISAIPMAIMVYIIAFGDFVTGEALIKEADEIRKDEKIDFNSNRSNLISGFRNVVMAFITPYVPLCGPLWAAVTAAVSQRYKEGREAMDSIFGGVGTLDGYFYMCIFGSYSITCTAGITCSIIINFTSSRVCVY